MCGLSVFMHCVLHGHQVVLHPPYSAEQLSNSIRVLGRVLFWLDSWGSCRQLCHNPRWHGDPAVSIVSLCSVLVNLLGAALCAAGGLLWCQWGRTAGSLQPSQHCLGGLQRDRDVSLRELGSCVLQLWFENVCLWQKAACDCC